MALTDAYSVHNFLPKTTHRAACSTSKDCKQQMTGHLDESWSMARHIRMFRLIVYNYPLCPEKSGSLSKLL